MRVSIESTSKVVEVNGVPARIWEGKTESGIPVMCCIALISPLIDRDSPSQAEFQRKLKETRAPSAEVEAIPLRMIL